MNQTIGVHVLEAKRHLFEYVLDLFFFQPTKTLLGAKFLSFQTVSHEVASFRELGD